MMFSFSAKADIVSEGEIKLEFMFTNLDKFPGFTYYYLHYGYHYNMGWKANPPDTVLVRNNERYTAGDRGSVKSNLFALPMANSNNKFLVSSRTVGGGANVNPTINSIVEVFTIVSMENGTISIRKEKEIIRYKDGREEDGKAGTALLGAITNDHFNSGLTLISTGALLVMLLVFLFKKRKPKYIQLAT